ncbi:hypothetical protein [Amycolatopsis sp. DG1A-15b]|uniref:hypothetical protein n=1 Tax=Amycolatopsis sp. DG1A-15b TaxID=3052846 RepID=UPI00255B70B0|nr:hypothetical protein [Amycolatopsis sp. DG1A-15b]WIX86785.1 hypothetical protein QRY02_37285 [Amycolatopsis sp. DG1A-15b]
MVLLAACTGETPAPPPGTTTPPPSSATALPDGLTGGRASGGIGVTALLPTVGPTLFDADRGPVATPPGYPTGDIALSVVRVGKHAVLTVYPPYTQNPDPYEVLEYTGPSSPPRSLGRAWSVAPDAAGDGVWLIRQDAPDDCRLQHVSFADGELGRGQSASCRTQVRSETAHGLLITINAGAAESTDALIEPATGRTVRQAPRILGVAGDWMLLDGLADLTLVDLRDNRSKQLSRPAIGAVPTVVPSREGAVWAADFANPAYRNTSTQTRDLWLLRPAGPTWEHVPGMPFVTEHLKRGGGFDWSDAGDLVLADGALAAWHPGEPQWRLSSAALPPGSWSGLAVLP